MGRLPGSTRRHADYNSFITFSDPDGNGWLVQEIRVRAPGGELAAGPVRSLRWPGGTGSGRSGGGRVRPRDQPPRDVLSVTPKL